MAALLEHDAKALLARAGIRVPFGRACASVDEVASAVAMIGTPMVVKALVPAKGKQLAGGVQFAASAAEAVQHAAQLLGSTIAGFPVRQVLVEACETLVAQVYASVALYGPTKSYRLTVARRGGEDVESEIGSGAACTFDFNPRALPWPHQICDLLLDCGIEGVGLRSLPGAITKLCACALAADATLIEVNPIGLLPDATACAIGVLASVDESALYRQPLHAEHAIARVEQLLRPLTPWEEAMQAINAALPDGGDIRFGEFPEGDIGMMVLGGGAGLMALDAVERAGGRPANFFDMTSTTGQAEEKVYRVTRNFLEMPRLRGLFIGSNIGAFLPVAVRLRGIARALREMPSGRGRFPVVIRLAGIGDDEVLPILDGLPVTYLRDEVTLEEAADVFMRKLAAAS